MNKPQTALEFGQHLAKLVTPKDISGYHRILSDNEKFIAHEVEAYAQQRCASLVERVRDLEAMIALSQTALAQFKGEKVDAKR